MGKNKEQTIARCLQSETGCSYMMALNRVRQAAKAERFAGMAPNAVYDEIALMTAEQLGIRRAEPAK